MKNNLQPSASAISSWAPLDRRPMHQWARGLRLPRGGYAISGKFSTEVSRYMDGVMEAIQDEFVREVTVCKAIQTGGTLCSTEIPIAWALVNAPGPIMWTHQTDKAVKEHVKGRFNSFIRKVPQIKAMMPTNRNDVTNTEMYFGDAYLLINAANLSSLQSKSIRWKFNTEVWLWEQGLLQHARGRVRKFEEIGTSKVVNESQASYDGDDFHKAFLEGDQATWSVKCFGCGKHSQLEFFGHAAEEPEKRACVIWNESARRSDNSWNIADAAASARWMCPLCGQEHADEPRTRTLWNASGMYIPLRLDAPKQKRSFRWNSLVSRKLSEMVAEFLNANVAAKSGVFQAMKDFKMQSLSLFWKEDTSTDAVLLRGSGYLLTAPTISAKVESETARFLTIDRQRDHFWCVVRAWRENGGSRLLYRGRVNTVEQLGEIQGRFEIEPNRAFEDAGYFPSAVYLDCEQRGWIALKGSGDNYFAATNKQTGRKIKRLWSDVSWIQGEKKQIPLIHWASDPVKDVLHNLRSGLGAPWEVADDAGQEYESQLNGDRKKEFVNKKSGRQEWRWVRVHANHFWDCEAMQVTAALMLGILASPEAIAEPVTEPTP